MELRWIWLPPWQFPPSFTITTSNTLCFFLVIIIIFLYLTHLSNRPYHPQEPSIVACPLPIPYIGHLILMALQGGHYIRSLGLAHQNRHLPIFTLVLPFGARMYVVTSPALTTAVQRKPARELSANAMLPGVVKRIMGLDEETGEIVRRGVDGTNGGEGGGGKADGKGVLEDLHGMMVGYLGVGKNLDQLTAEAVRALVGEMDGFLDGDVSSSTMPASEPISLHQEERESENRTHDLLPWVRHLVMCASARVLYGPRNPFTVEREKQRQNQQQQQQHSGDDTVKHQDGNLETDFWNWDHGLGQLLIGIWPSVTARVPYHARERLVAAFRTYIDAKHYEPEDKHTSTVLSSSSNDKYNINRESGKTNREQEHTQATTGAAPIVFNRIRIARAHGFSPDGIARSELSFLFASMVNTATVAFWTLLRVFADDELLDAVREELVRGGLVRDCGEDEQGKEQELHRADGGSASTSQTKSTAASKTAKKKRHLSLSALTANKYEACPTLYAVLQEVLRLASNNFSTRLVMENTYITPPATIESANVMSTAGAGQINGQTHRYFLKRGGIVQIAGGVMHMNPSIWGQDANEFRPGRHQPLSSAGSSARQESQDEPSTTETRQVHRSTTARSSAFRGFGGGKTICPGRYFATAEILGFVACTVLRMEIEGVNDLDKDANNNPEVKVKARPDPHHHEQDGLNKKKSRAIKVPEVDDYILPVHVLEPASGETVRVRIKQREGAAGERIEVVP
ncbi:cytochrome P450 [Coniella lustricola]|uniref:Cytochrome P450 n=1 Tax=Coniella lustricola TaxID=2025994 RepID=A0A2T3AM41_9PEZI|nr:cytochrome P450 [Coniella lustricola]